MSFSSGTDSESGGHVLISDATDTLASSANLVAGPIQLAEALKTLREVDICDEAVFDQVSLASSAIRHQLDRIIKFVPSGNVEESEVQDTLFSLLNHSTLLLLFNCRAVIHVIMARHTSVEDMSTFVCWVDVILAKLGQAVIVTAGFSSFVASDLNPPAILVHREDDMLRAAVQLPNRWSDIVMLLNSDHSSPAAIRLASSLLFGVHVMAPQLGGHDHLKLDCEVGPSLPKALIARIRRTVAHDRQCIPLAGEAVDEQERITSAFFVALYAVAASVDPSALDLSCRPHSATVLLEMIQSVLQCDPGQCIMSVILTPVDNAKMILTKWGMTVSWAWSTWTDGRLHNAEVLEHLTAIWLQDVNGVPRWPLEQGTVTCIFNQRDCADVLANSPGPAVSMMTRLLICTLYALNSNAGSSYPSKSASKFIARLCWSLQYLLEIAKVDQPSTAVIYSTMCTLYATLPDTGSELSDALLGALSYSPKALKVAADVFLDQKANYSIAFDEKLRSSSRDLVHAPLRHYPKLRIARQTAQFLTIVWVAGAPMYFHAATVQQFISALLNRLKLAGSSARCPLLDAIVSLMTVIKKRRDEITFQALDRCIDDKIVWALTGSAESSNAVIASSLAGYISVTAHVRSCDDLLWAETWSYLRDALLITSTIDKVALGSEKSLGLFVAPAICRALLSLLEHAGENTRRYYLSSSWTTALKTHLTKLHRLENCCEGGDFDLLLRQRITSVAGELYNYMEQHSESQKTAPSLGIESVYCFIHTMPCLLLRVC